LRSKGVIVEDIDDLFVKVSERAWDVAKACGPIPPPTNGQVSQDERF
jgi:hypothetical protein